MKLQQVSRLTPCCCIVTWTLAALSIVLLSAPTTFAIVWDAQAATDNWFDPVNWNTNSNSNLVIPPTTDADADPMTPPSYSASDALINFAAGTWDSDGEGVVYDPSPTNQKFVDAASLGYPTGYDRDTIWRLYLGRLARPHEGCGSGRAYPAPGRGDASHGGAGRGLPGLLRAAAARPARRGTPASHGDAFPLVLEDEARVARGAGRRRRSGRPRPAGRRPAAERRHRRARHPGRRRPRRGPREPLPGARPDARVARGGNAGQEPAELC